MDDDFAAELQSIEQEIAGGKTDVSGSLSGAGSGNAGPSQTSVFGGFTTDGNSHSHPNGPSAQQQLSGGGLAAGSNPTPVMMMLMGNGGNNPNVIPSSVFSSSFGASNPSAGTGMHLGSAQHQQPSQPPQLSPGFGGFGTNQFGSSAQSSLGGVGSANAPSFFPSNASAPSSSGKSGSGNTNPRMNASPSSPHSTHVFSKDTDERSVFVGNLPKHLPITQEELTQFFSECGPILNCTLLKDRVTQELKGTAYIEFASYSAMGKAIDTMNNAVFKGSSLIVTKKRSAFRPDRARGGRGGRGMGMTAGAPAGVVDPYQTFATIMGLMSAGAAAGTMRGGYRGRGGRGRGGASGNPDSNAPNFPFS